MDILLTLEHYQNQPHLQSTIIPGFIQEYAFTPFNISLYTERQFTILKEYFAYNPYSVLTLDSTGQIIATLPPRYKNKTVLYYSLVAHLPGAEESPVIPVLEYLTNVQTAWNNSNILHVFFRKYCFIDIFT